MPIHIALCIYVGTGPVLLLKFSENFSRFRHFGRSLTETKRSEVETVNSRFRLGFQDGDAGSAGAMAGTCFGTLNKLIILLLFCLHYTKLVLYITTLMV